MIKVPIFDPSNIGIGEKLDYVKLNQERYIELTNYDSPIGYINFILPGYVDDKPNLDVSPISPYLVDKGMVSGFYNEDIMLYINYFGSFDDIAERIHMYSNDYILKEKRISPQWKMVVFFPPHSAEATLGIEKFNMKYGVQLVGPDINLLNINKYIEMGFNHFNLISMIVDKEMTLDKANQTLIKEVAAKHPNVEFLIYSSDSESLVLPENCRVVVGSGFWKKFYID
jgi:hypothetical protein